MNNTISPKYQMSIIGNINERLFELYKSYNDVENYLRKWHEDYGGYGDNENFHFYFKENEPTKIDVKRILHSVEGETLLKMAIDLGVETPDFIPCIPTFRNELKSNYKTASDTFDKAFKNVEDEPSLAIGLAYSALESIIKEILKDSRIHIQYGETDTLISLTKSICKAFKINADNSFPPEIKAIANSLMTCSKNIEDLRSNKTFLHGKTDGCYIISDPTYAYFVVNAVSTIGLFLMNYYKNKYPPQTNDVDVVLNEDDFPF